MQIGGKITSSPDYFALVATSLVRFSSTASDKEWSFGRRKPLMGWELRGSYQAVGYLT